MGSRTQCGAACGALVLGLALADPVLAAPSYTITDLGTLGGAYSYAVGINSRGVVAGTSVGGKGTRAFDWQDGRIRDLGTLPEAFFSYAIAINDAGQVLGGSDQGDVTRTVIWEQGVPRVVPIFGVGSTTVSDFNTAGEIVDPYWETVWRSDGGATELSPLQLDEFGFPRSRIPFGINEASQVVGSAEIVVPGQSAETHAVRWDDGRITDLGTLGGTIAAALEINEAGQAVGYSALSGDVETHVVLWDNDRIIDLGLNVDLSGPSDTHSYYASLDINDKGQIVGQSVEHDLFLFEGGTIFSLTSLVTNLGSWQLSYSAGINNDGWIVGTGTNPAGEMQAFLLIPNDSTPVPEPRAAVLLGLAIASLAFARRRAG